jgi:hypothetical protein
MMMPTQSTPTRRGVMFSAAAIVAGFTIPTVAGAADPDAELIALCDRIVQNEAKQAGLFTTLSDDDERDAALDLLSLEWRDILTQIEQIDGPTTMAGTKAMARAALAMTPLNLDGGIKVGSNPEDWLYLCVAKFTAGSASV